ncbi:uncharacterized protein VTP21DRAFT_2519 [Calcarisporiella thermophila]|uniref:uncharacterized protein n=1 Tax=Calcarisporiella thermophila TaxID=911321 RepID=UPI003744AE64
MKLNCVLYEQGDKLSDSFSVEVNGSNTVEDLKEKIMAKAKERFKNLDSLSIQLWKVDYSQRELKQIIGDFRKIEKCELFATDDISEVFPEPPRKKNIHIIIEMPSVRSMGSRKLGIIEAFPNGLPYERPKPLLRTIGSTWEYQPAPDLYSILRKELLAHFQHYRSGFIDKSTMPLYLFLSGAGTGKSRNATEFHTSLLECLPEGQSELRSIIRNAWVFHVSLENGSTIIDGLESNAFLAIGTRMLWQLLPEQALLEVIRTYEPPDPLSVIQLVAKYEGIDWKNATVILVVDGLQTLLVKDGDSLDENSTFSTVLANIGDLAHIGMFLIPCCTSTIFGPVDKYIRYSQRHRVYLPVASLSPPIIRRGNTRINAFREDDYVLSILVSDCAGHGRALEALYEALNNVNLEEDNIEDLMHELFYIIKSRYSQAIKISARDANAVVRAILSHRRLKVDEIVPGTNKTPDQLAQPGLIRFELYDDSSKGYLNAPYIWIWVLARIIPPEDDLILRDWKFCDYGELRSKIDPRSPPGAQFWQHFEYFVASFRCLKSRAFDEGELRDISEIHKGARLNGDIKIINHHLSLECATQWEDTKACDRLPGKWNVKCEFNTVNVREGRHCILNGTSAPYGDSFLGLDLGSKDEFLSEVHQYKHFSVSRLSKELYQRERDKAVSYSDFFILYTTNDAGNFELPERSGIVDKTNWLDYFGPFAGRAYRFAVVGPLDINSAKRGDILRVGGIGQSYAERIIGKRPFKDLADAMAKTDIPESLLKKFKFSSQSQDDI